MKSKFNILYEEYLKDINIISEPAIKYSHLRKTEYTFTKITNSFTNKINEYDFSIPSDKIELFINSLKINDLIQEYKNLYTELMSGILNNTIYADEIIEGNYKLIEISILQNNELPDNTNKIIFNIVIPYQDLNWFNSIFRETLESIK